MTTPTLLLIHGLGSTPGLWADVLSGLQWSGKIINAELPGHGQAAAQDDYTMGALAASVSSQCESGEEVIAVGHSLGGCVALCLASGFFRPVVRATVGVGLKIVWTDDDVNMMAHVAGKGVRWFDTRDEAVDRFLVQSGLTGVVSREHASVESGVAEVDGRWRVAQDPATFAQRPVDMHGLMAAAKGPVLLGAGEHDNMVTSEHMRPYVDDPRIARGCGHNVPVEDPAWLISLIDEAAVLGADARDDA